MLHGCSTRVPGVCVVVGSGEGARISRWMDFASRLATNAGGKVGEMGEMDDAAPVRVNAIGSGSAAVRAYNASCCSELGHTTRYRIALAAAVIVVEVRASS